MTTFNAGAVADAAIAHKKGISLQTGRAFRDNPKAAAEGQPGAYKFAQKTLGGAGTNIAVDIGGLGAFGGVIVHGHFDGDGPSDLLQLALSNDGATFYGTVTLQTITAATSLSFTLAVDFATGNYSYVSPGTYTTGTIAGASLSATTVRLHANGVASNVSFMMLPNGGESAS